MKELYETHKQLTDDVDNESEILDGHLIELSAKDMVWKTCWMH